MNDSFVMGKRFRATLHSTFLCDDVLAIGRIGGGYVCMYVCM